MPSLRGIAAAIKLVAVLALAVLAIIILYSVIHWIAGLYYALIAFSEAVLPTLSKVLVLIVGGIIAWLAVLLAKALWKAKREAERAEREARKREVEWQAERAEIAERARKREAWREAQREADREAQREADREAWREAARKITVERELRVLLDKHLRTLALKKRQLITSNAYGIEDFSKWIKERSYFVDHVMLPNLSSMPTSDQMESFIQSIESRTTNLDIIAYPFDNYEETLDASEFEKFCAQLARRVGWDARVTQGSGDQGIDVIASNGTHKVVFQCKSYTSAVGNKAVQEIFAGKHFENADYAAVVSNAPFTPAARLLASSTGVALLHHSELEQYLRNLTPAWRE